MLRCLFLLSLMLCLVPAGLRAGDFDAGQLQGQGVPWLLETEESERGEN